MSPFKVLVHMLPIPPPPRSQTSQGPQARQPVAHPHLRRSAVRMMTDAVPRRALTRPQAAVSVRIAVVDGDVLTREGIAAIVGRTHGVQLLGATADVATAIASWEETPPEVIFVEAWRASESEGSGIRTLLRALPTTRVIAFGAGLCEEEAFHVLDAGASGYVVRDCLKTDLMRAVRVVRAGESYVPAGIQELLNRRQRRPSLTPRELGVLELLAHARSNAAIAAVLGIAVGTAKLHVKAILAKLGVEDRAEAAVVAMERGLSRRLRPRGIL